MAATVPADVLADLWARALQVLDDFAEARSGGSEFWKRVPRADA